MMMVTENPRVRPECQNKLEVMWGEGSWEGCCKQSPWLLIESCQEKRKVILAPVELCYRCRTWELPLLVSLIYLTEVSVYQVFIFSLFDQDLSLKASLIKSQIFKF